MLCPEKSSSPGNGRDAKGVELNHTAASIGLSQDIRMVHKLFIRPEVRHKESHRGYLQPYAVVRGQPSNIVFSVTNIGEEPFPGGTVTGIVIYYGDQRQITSQFNDRIEIKALQPQVNSETAEAFEFVPTTDGHAWLHFKIETADDSEIEYYQVRDDEPLGTSGWFGVIYVVNREQLAIIDLLHQLCDEKGE